MSFQELQKIISPKFSEEVLLNIVSKKSELSDIQVKKIEIDTSSKKGDSYLSTICRFTVDAVGKNKNGQEVSVSIPVFTKFPPKSLGRREATKTAQFFENEIIFFERVWSAFQKFQTEVKVSEKFDNVPWVLSTYFDGTNDYVAMTDLIHEGYTTAERGIGLNYDHAIPFLQILARFHALSLAFKEKHPEEFESAATSLKETLFSEELRSWHSSFQNNLIVVVRDAVEKELPSEYLHKLDAVISGDFHARLAKLCMVRGPLSVVTHGDIWIPNFLIKYGGSNPMNIKMIDFQLSRYTTLVGDLLTLIFACISMDLIENKLDELIEVYHQTLVGSMDKYGARNSIPLDALYSEIKQYGVFGVRQSMEALVIGQLEDEDVGDLDAMGDEVVSTENIWKMSPFKEQEKRKRIATMIKLAVDRNFI